MYKPRRIYIDSTDRRPYENPQDFTVSLGNNMTLEGVESIQVDSLIFPNSLYSINNNNNKLYMSMRRYSSVAPTTFTEQVFSATIDPGHYTPDELIAVLKSKIETSFQAAYPANPIFTLNKISYSAITKRFTIELNAQSYGRGSSTQPGGNDIDWFIVLDQNYTSYPNGFKNSLNYVLGFENQTTTYPANITAYIDTPIVINCVSTVLHRLSGISYVYLHTNIINSAITSSDNNNANSILTKVSLPNEYGDTLYSHFGSSNDLIPVNLSKIDTIRFWVTDSNFNIVDLNGSDFSFSLLLNYF